MGKFTAEERASRIFNVARKEQGFRDQDHLSKFFTYLDHRAGCEKCQKPGGGFWNEGDASWQPTVSECAEASNLLRACDNMVNFEIYRN